MYLFEIVDDHDEDMPCDKVMYISMEPSFLDDGFPDDFYDMIRELEDRLGFYELQECIYEVAGDAAVIERELIATGQFQKSEAFTEYVNNFGN